MSNNKKIYPEYEYSIPSEIIKKASKYHFIKVPLLGQYNTIKKEEDWCGRTSSSIVYNYYQMVQNSNFKKDDLICHGPEKNDGYGYNLRLSDGTPAFIILESKDKSMIGKAGEFSKAFPEGKESTEHLFPYDVSKTNRLKIGEQIADNEKLVQDYFTPILNKLKKGKPLVFYSGFSGKEATPIHLIVLCGFCYLPDINKEEKLWILAADPSTQNSKISIHGIFKPPFDPEKDKGISLEKLSWKQSDYDRIDFLDIAKNDFIRIKKGAKKKSKGSLVLIRASKFFRTNIASEQNSQDLYMDYWQYHQDNKGAIWLDKRGGYYKYATNDVAIPKELIVSNIQDYTHFPIKIKGNERSPLAYYDNNESIESGLGGYFALGLQRNIHAGIHLFPPDENKPVNKKKLKQPADKQYTELKSGMAEESYIKDKGKTNKTSVADGLIQSLQKKLEQLGFFSNNGNYVGNYGNLTKSAVEAFQIAAVKNNYSGSYNSCNIPGVADAKTQKEIDFWLINDLPPKKDIKNTTNIKKGYTPIHAFADGYIVAARLPDSKTDNDNKEIISFSNNYPGFVLLCNEYCVAGDEEKKKHRIYNLYMHLTPPDYTNIEKDPYTLAVPWFEKLAKKRHGAFVNITGNGDSIGTICWLKAPIADKTQIAVGQKFEVFDHESIEAITKDKDGNEVVDWVYKDAPVDYVEIYNNLSMGLMITTSSPVFPVSGNEILGFVSKNKDALEKEMSFTIGADENGAGGEDVVGKITTGFLHWEVFASHDGSDEKPLDKLFEILGKDFYGDKADGNKILTEIDCLSNDDNFWTPDEFSKSVLSGITNEDEKKYLEAGFEKEADNENGKNFQYAENVVEMLNDPKSFNNSEDQSEPEVDEYVGNTYDCTINVNCSGFAESKDGHYYLNLDYLNIVDDKKRIITTRKLKVNKSDACGNKKLTYKIKVPIGANAIEVSPHVSTKDFFVEVNNQDDNNTKEVMQNVLSHRWRNTILRMNTEWKYENFKKLIEKLNSELHGVSIDAKKVGGMTWWGHVGEKSDYWYDFGSKAMVIKYAPLFKETFNADAHSDDVPFLNENGQITAVHPVTAAWAWNYLEGKSKISSVGSSIAEEIAFNDDYQPICWGINRVPVDYDVVKYTDDKTKAKTISLGLPAKVTIVDDDFALGKQFNAVQPVFIHTDDKNKKQKLIGPKSSFGKGGVYSKEFIIDFWDKWTLYPFYQDDKKYDSLKSNNNIGLTSFNVEPPAFAQLEEKDKSAFTRIYKGSNNWTFMLKMAKPYNWLNGLIKVDVSKDGKSWEKGKYYLPVIEAKYSTGEFKSDTVNYDNLNIKDNIITLNNPEKKSLRVNVTQKIKKRENDYIYDNFIKQVSCSLADFLQACSEKYTDDWVNLKIKEKYKNRKTGITIDWVCCDGINCKIHGKRYFYSAEWKLYSKDDEGKASKTINNVKLFEAAKSIIAQYAEFKVEISEDNANIQISINDKSKLKTKSECKKIIDENDLELSSNDKFIYWLTNKKTKISDKFCWSEYENVHDVRISTMLAHGIEKLYIAQKNETPTFIVSHIGWNGLFCKIKGTHLLNIASSLNVFDLVEIDGVDLKLTVLPPLKDALAVKFKSLSKLEQIVSNELKDTKKVLYRVGFIALSGMQFSQTFNGYEEPVCFDSNTGKKIIDECPGSIEYPIVSKNGNIEKVFLELKIFNIKLAPNSGKLIISANLKGEKSIWIQSAVVLKQRLKGGEYKEKDRVNIVTGHFDKEDSGMIHFTFDYPDKKNEYEYTMEIIEKKQSNVIISEKISTEVNNANTLSVEDYWMNWQNTLKSIAAPKIDKEKDGSSEPFVSYNFEPAIKISKQPKIDVDNIILMAETTGVYPANSYGVPFNTNIKSGYGEGKAFYFAIKKGKEIIAEKSDFNYEYTYNNIGGFVNYDGQIIAKLNLDKTKIKNKVNVKLRELLKKENGPFKIIIKRSVNSYPIIDAEIDFLGID